jgi:tetratricopeptide (TPR) repeat protein
MNSSTIVFFTTDKHFAFENFGNIADDRDERCMGRSTNGNKRRQARLASRRMLEAVVMTGLLLAAAACTLQRNDVWKSQTSLWIDCVSKSPAKGRTHNNLAFVYNKAERPEQAISEANLALELRGNFPTSYVVLGDAYGKIGLYEKAIESYQKSIDLDPGYFEPYFGLGYVYAGMNNMTAAMEAFKKSSSLRPRHVTSRINLAAAYGQLGMTDQAIEELKRCLDLDPDNADIHYNLGLAFEKVNLLPQAIREYASAVRLRPDDKDALRKHLDLMRIQNRSR